MSSYAYLNSSFETGFANPIDQAVRRYCCPDISGYRKLDEVPYDFIRKRLSMLVAKEGEPNLMVTKGALSNVLAVCSQAETAGGPKPASGAGAGADSAELCPIQRAGAAHPGGRLSADWQRRPDIGKDDEAGMTFLGFLLVYDPPKPGVAEVIRQMKRTGGFPEDHHRRQRPGGRQRRPPGGDD